MRRSAVAGLSMLRPAGGVGRVPEVLVALAIFSGTLFNGYDSTAGQATCCIVNALLLIALVLTAPPSPTFWRRAAPVIGLGSVALLWSILVTVQADGSLPDYAPGKILSIVAGWSALLAGGLMGRRRSEPRARLLDWLLALNCLGLVLGLVLRQANAGGLFDYWTVVREARFQGTIGNTNVTAALAGANAILAFQRLLGLAANRSPSPEARNPLPLIAYLLAFTLCAGVVLLTASRFTNVLLLGLLAAAVLPLAARRRAWRLGGMLGIAIGGALLLVLLTQYSDVLQERLDRAGAGWRGRTEMWSHFTELALQSPLTGYGLGSFPSVNAHFLGSPRLAQAIWAMNSPHNLFLQLLLGAGLPYLLLTLAAAGVVAIQTRSTLRFGAASEDAAIIGMIVLILGCSMVDVVLDMPASVTFTLFLAGLLWGRALSSAGSQDRRAGSLPSEP